MSNYARYRDWHMWIGLVLLVPLSVIATTGLLWNHEQSLGLKGAHESPLATDPAAIAGPPQSAAMLVAAPHTWTEHAGAVESALSAAALEWGGEIPLERIELKAEPGQGVVVKVKAPEEADVQPYEIVWSASSNAIIERKGAPQQGRDWAKLVHDLHTGKFFSRRLGFLWSDSGALAILALGATGVVLYLIPVLKKRGKSRASAVVAAGRSGRVLPPAVSRSQEQLVSADLVREQT